MKTINKIIYPVLFAVLLALPLNLSAYQLPEFVIINAGLGKQFGLKVEGLQSDDAEFTVSSPSGEVFLHQRIDGDDYQALYSLEEMQEGKYVFVLKTKAAEIRQPVELTKRTIYYRLSERKIVVAPAVALKGRQLDVDFHNPTLERFEIKLLLSNGDALYREVFEARSDIEKRINLLKVPGGNYRLEMSTPSARWYELIEVR